MRSAPYVAAGGVLLALLAVAFAVGRYPVSLSELLSVLAGLFYPRRFPGDLRMATREFYRLFYHVDLNDEDLERLIEWASGKAPP